LTTFAPILVPAELRHATSDTAWLSAMLDAERAQAAHELAAAVLSRYRSIVEP
jgi:hypothetical protein